MWGSAGPVIMCPAHLLLKFLGTCNASNFSCIFAHDLKVPYPYLQSCWVRTSPRIHAKAFGVNIASLWTNHTQLAHGAVQDRAETVCPTNHWEVRGIMAAGSLFFFFLFFNGIFMFFFPIDLVAFINFNLQF